MTMPMDVRAPATIPLVERSGYRYRQYLGTADAAHDLLSPGHPGFGALRLFNDVVLDANSRASFDAYDGLETIAYVLEGACHVAYDRGEPVELTRGSAARIIGGHGARFEAHNRTAGPSRILIAATVTEQAQAQVPFTKKAFDPDTAGVVWLEGKGAEESAEWNELGSSTRLGVAFLPPGVVVEFSSVIDRGLYLNVISGQVGLNSTFVDGGGDARLSLEAGAARLQGISPARVVVADVPTGFVQEL